MDTTILETGDRVSYQDVANPRAVGTIVEIQTSRWGTQYGIRMDDSGTVEWSDCRQAGWALEVPAPTPAFEVVAELTAEVIGEAVEFLEETYTPATDPANPYAVGSVWATSWGYDQTNVEFYEVVRETRASVWTRPIGAEVREGRLYPTPGEYVSEWRNPEGTPEMHRKGRSPEYPSLHMDDVRTAWPYEGGGRYDTLAAGQPGH